MLIGLVALIIALLAGGQDTFLLNPNLKKEVKIYVEDKNRKSEIDHLIKQVEKDQKGFLKHRKKSIKKLTKLNTDFNSTRNQFDELLNEYHDQRVALQHRYLDREIEIRKLIESDEWDKIMEAVIGNPDKMKARKQVLASNNKMYDNLIKTCERKILNKDSQVRAKTFINQHRATTEAFTEAFLDLSYRHLEPIRDYKATRNDFESIREQMSNQHKKYLDSVIDLRFDLVTLVTEKEWKGISPELNTAFKKGKGGA